MEAVDPMAVEAGSMVEVVSTAVEDFTEVVDLTAVEDFTEGVGSTVEAGFAAGAASEAEWDLAAAAGFVAARSAEEGDFAEGQDFAVEGSTAAFAATASAVAGAGADEVGEDEIGIGTIGASVLAGAGLTDIGPDTRIRMGMGTTRGGLRPTTVFLLMILTMIPMILTMTRHLHTQIGLTRIDIGTAGTRIRHRRAPQ
jgi:hypothetical protein